MPRAKGVHSIDIPTNLWEALDQVARIKDEPTNYLISVWLWQRLKHIDREDPRLAGISAPQPRDRQAIYPRRNRTTAPAPTGNTVDRNASEESSSQNT